MWVKRSFIVGDRIKYTPLSGIVKELYFLIKIQNDIIATNVTLLVFISEYCNIKVFNCYMNSDSVDVGYCNWFRAFKKKNKTENCRRNIQVFLETDCAREASSRSPRIYFILFYLTCLIVVNTSFYDCS